MILETVKFAGVRARFESACAVPNVSCSAAIKIFGFGCVSLLWVF